MTAPLASPPAVSPKFTLTEAELCARDQARFAEGVAFEQSRMADAAPTNAEAAEIAARLPSESQIKGWAAFNAGDLDDLRTELRAALADAAAFVRRAARQPAANVEQIAIIIDPEAFGFPRNPADYELTERDEARRKASEIAALSPAAPALPAGIVERAREIVAQMDNHTLRPYRQHYANEEGHRKATALVREIAELSPPGAAAEPVWHQVSQHLWEIDGGKTAVFHMMGRYNVHHCGSMLSKHTTLAEAQAAAEAHWRAAQAGERG